ncbi:hypothetical protein GGS20DRAFT_143327 [Poronia punctata]|nr:hypothetical protein GGS20DRAFT_143327 [Poronia punctata]
MGLFKSASTAGRGRPAQTPPHSHIRGKISGPIPIDEVEFPSKGPGPGTTPEASPNQKGPASSQRESMAASTKAFHRATASEGQTNSLSQSGPSQDSTASTPVRRRRTNRSSTLRYSMASEATEAGSPNQKKSGLRGAIGKLFGRRNKTRGSRSTSDSEGQIGSSHDRHRSESVVVKREPGGPETSPKRSASLPVTEFNQALRSHSIGPDDYMAIHSFRNSLQSDTEILRRMAATTSGGALNFGLRDETTDITGLSPRPASAHGRDMTDEHERHTIGRALSIDMLASHRRSRSLSQLPEVAEGHSLGRKRSEEIRYWRESHVSAPLSPALSDPKLEDPEVVKSAEPARDTYEDIGVTTAPSRQPFHLGPISTMKAIETASLEHRVSILESQNHKLERLVAQLSQSTAGVDRYRDPVDHLAREVHAPPSAAAYPATTSGAIPASIREEEGQDTAPPSTSYSTSQRSYQSFGEDDQTFVGSINPSTKEVPRPLSNLTIRGTTSLPSIPRDVANTFTMDHYNSLRIVVDTERAARQALEVRVNKLTRLVESMSRATPQLDTDVTPGEYSDTSPFEGNHGQSDVEPLSASIGDSSENFETRAVEYANPEFDALDEGRHDDEMELGSRKRAARTLSLGQLTHGKPKNHPQPGAGVDL